MKKNQGPATSWEHRGVTITFDGHATRPEFVADAPGKSLRAPSLDAIKKKIDQLSVATFQAFDAYVEFGGYGTPEAAEGLEIVETFKSFEAEGWHKGGGTAYLLKVKIVALDKSEGEIRFMPGTTEKLRASRSGGLDHVLPYTEEVRLAWLAERRANFAEDKAACEHQNKRQAAREVLEAYRIKADEYEAGKPPVVAEAPKSGASR